MERESKATYLPVDLLSEILLRLPVKSAVKFRCVSKVWSSITTRPSFISSFAARSSPRLLIFSENKGKLLVFSIPQNQNTDNKPQLVESYAMTYPGTRSVFYLLQCISHARSLEPHHETHRNLTPSQKRLE
ncbi:putative F-box protein At1g50870 [Raphanus sativus]|uniref:F-box protein At1g50870 n=1 Tax=Raphanus sativus TaxID=3726 RepID=A0A9W3C1T5_RAPSA|nr:putative F-box protein At1g50870 [Raphanus sativus]